MKNKYYYVIRRYGRILEEKLVPGAKTLEDCDLYTANHYTDNNDLCKKLINRNCDGHTSVTIKEITITEDENGKRKQKSNDKRYPIYPIYDKITKKHILELCQKAIQDREKINARGLDAKYMLNNIIIIMRKENIEYIDIRECYIQLRQLGYFVSLPSEIKKQEDKALEETTRRHKTVLRKNSVENHNFPDEAHKEYANELKEKAFASDNLEDFEGYYQEYLDFVGGYEYNRRPIPKKGERR